MQNFAIDGMKHKIVSAIADAYLTALCYGLLRAQFGLAPWNLLIRILRLASAEPDTSGVVSVTAIDIEALWSITGFGMLKLSQLLNLGAVSFSPFTQSWHTSSIGF